MARFTKEVLEKKKREAKELYVKGFEIETISEIINVSATTIGRWAKIDEYEQARNSKYIALSELRNVILQSFIDMKDGKKPNIKPDEAAKFAAAFEKLSDKKKVLSYMHDNYEMLTDELIKEVQETKGIKNKEFALAVLKKVREVTDDILTRTTAETLNEN